MSELIGFSFGLLVAFAVNAFWMVRLRTFEDVLRREKDSMDALDEIGVPRGHVMGNAYHTYRLYGRVRWLMSNPTPPAAGAEKGE